MNPNTIVNLLSVFLGNFSEVVNVELSMDRMVSEHVDLLFYYSGGDVCLVLSWTPAVCFLRLTFLVAMDILRPRRELMLRRLFSTWMVYAFYPMLILFFLLKGKWPTSSKNLHSVKLMEMLLSWDSLFNHAKGLRHLWKLCPSKTRCCSDWKRC